jgi:hypothetical protein
MNQIRIYSILIMLIIMPFSGCISSNEIVEESSIPTHVIVQEDTPSKISFNKQDELMALELRAVNPAWTPLPVSWESLLLIVSNGEEEYGCVPPLLSSRVELVGDGPATVRINEIVVSNDNGAQDEKGDYDDWIELFNPGEEDMNLSGWMLTDAYQEWATGGKEAYIIPNGTIIPSAGFTIIWADDEITEEGLHANFKLKAAGEMISLIRPDGEVHQNLSWGATATDVSIAAVPDGSVNFQTDRTPSHGRSNGAMSGANVLPESAPGSLGTGCMIIESNEDEIWGHDEVIFITEDGVDICGIGDRFPTCSLTITATLNGTEMITDPIPMVVT